MLRESKWVRWLGVLGASLSLGVLGCSSDNMTDGTGGSAGITGTGGGGGAGGEDVGPPPGSLQASLVRSSLHVPPNTAMGGYGDRTEDHGFENPTTDPRTVEVFYNARGLIQRLSLKALLLENDHRRVIMLRLPLIFPTDLMRDQIIENVQEATGEDIRYELFLGATHTHAGPARYLEAPDLFGQVGLDTFQQEMFIQLTDELARVVLEVMAAERVPVALSYGANDDFDPEGRVNRDRREEDDNLYFHQNGILCAMDDTECQATGESVTKDPRLHIVRIDRADGSPFVIIANLPVHGTVFGGSNPYMSEDAPGLIEAKTEEYFQNADDLGQVTVLLMQGTAGNVSPGDSEVGHQGNQRTEAVGIAAAEKIAELYRTLPQGETEVEIEYFAKRFPIDRDRIGYAPNEFANGSQIYERGAFLCGSGYQEDVGVPETKMELDSIVCPIDITLVENIVMERVDIYDKTVLSVMRLGGLYILGLPGEATTPLGMEIHRRLLERYGIGRDDSVVYAYANDHQFYLLLEDDWLQGGYETTVNIWGPRFGDFLCGVVEDLVEPATTSRLEEAADLDELPEWEHVNWRELRTTDTGFDLYTTQDAGNPIVQPTNVERLDRVTFTFGGGDPLVDLPRVWLEVDSGPGGFVAVTRQDGRAMSDEGYELLLLHEQDGERSEWTAVYEFLATEPEGTYRFAYWGEEHVDGATETYGSAESPRYSDTFTVSARTSLALVNASVNGDTLTATIGYPVVDGAYRLRNYSYRQDAPDPVSGGTATITANITSDQVFSDVTIQDDGSVTVQLESAVSPGSSVGLLIWATDDIGNSNLTGTPIITNVTAQ